MIFGAYCVGKVQVVFDNEAYCVGTVQYNGT